MVKVRDERIGHAKSIVAQDIERPTKHIWTINKQGTIKRITAVCESKLMVQYWLASKETNEARRCQGIKKNSDPNFEHNNQQAYTVEVIENH
ncbi:hypothetical protein F8M41_009506 [Gigaspora margarita]|uniref:Uncharacterized protein n=1 Tax=Gigaspora margarita TaxID=4874 RepID=A0A8H3X567_GIGMA|nr:hypothetical protein F8M41_009506 [Gigaspora margarita]